MKLARSIVSLCVCMLVLQFSGHRAYAQGSASLHVSAANPSGTRIAGARVVLTNEASGVVTKSITGPDGAFDLTGLEPGSYELTITMNGFTDYHQKAVHLTDGQALAFQVMIRTNAVAQSVTVTAEGSPETSVTQATISRAEIEGVAGPFGSAAQALTAAPGVFVYGYGGVAATARSEVVVRGIKGGWSSVNGDVLKNGISFLFDGIPMNNMIANNGQWQTTQIPITDMISDINVDYGPGAPSNRWFDSLGGTINYIPVQPKSTPGATIAFGTDYGSYNTTLTHFIANSGLYRGWSMLLASGYASNDTFRVGTTGIPTFNAPSSGYSAFVKAEHDFINGSLSFGYYHGRNTEFRPNFIPLLDVNQGGDIVTTQGLYGVDAGAGSTVPANAQLYSQQSSGFYSSLAKDLWYKHIKTQSDILYTKLNLSLSPRLTFNTEEWFRHGYRLHDRVTNYYGPGYGNSHEWYDAASNTIGDRTDLSLQLPHNTVSFGGYWIHGGYNNPVSLFNPSQGTSITNPNFFNEDHLDNDYAFLYLQDRISLFHDKLIVTPGAAEQLFRTHFYNIGLSTFPNANPANDPNLSPATHKNFLKFSPSVGAQYVTTDWLTFHGNFAISFENPTDSAFGAGRPATGVDLTTLKPLRSQNTEAGFLVSKCPLAIMGTCSLDATYFSDKLSDETVITQTSNLALPATIALASAMFNGLSINFDESPMHYFQLHGNAIIQHDYFLSYIPSGSTTDYRSLPISNSPRYTTNMGLTTTFQTDSHRFVLTPGLWWQYVGQRYLFSNVTNAPTQQTTPGYGVVNFNMDGNINRLLPGRLADAPIKLSVGLENLLNKRYNPTAYITSGGYFGTSFGGYTLVDPGAPREFIFSINFGNK